MRHTAAFLALLACLTGGAVAETHPGARQQQEATVSKARQSKETTATNTSPNAGQPCSPAKPPVAAPAEPDPIASQNQVEYRGG